MTAKSVRLSNTVRQKALKISIQEGSAEGISTSIGAQYITPFAEAMHAQAIHISFLNALPGLLSPLAQIVGSNIMEKYSRKKIVLLFTFLQALMWFPIAVIALFAYQGRFTEANPWLLVGVYTLVTVFGSFAYPAWFSWIGDLVPEHERGKYFSLRSRTIGIVGLVAILACGFFLDRVETRGYALLGFAIVFTVAATARLISALLLKKQHHFPFKTNAYEQVSFLQFMKKKDVFRTFSWYLLWFNAAIMLASPFYAFYMLRELHFTYITFTIISLSATIVYLLCIPFAGSISDRYGNRRLMQLASACFVLTPLPWIFTTDPFWLIGTSQVLSGIGNAALIIAANNFTLDSVPPQRRARYTAYSNVLSGIGIFIGPLIGGLILKSLHPASLNPYIFLFIIAALARLLVTLSFMHGIKEVKKVARLPPLSLEITHPWKALHTDISWVRHVLR